MMTERNIIATVFFYFDDKGKLQTLDCLESDWVCFDVEGAVKELCKGNGAAVRPGAKAAVLATFAAMGVGTVQEVAL
jgi:hypothetical protein